MTAGSWPSSRGLPLASCSFAPAPFARVPSGSQVLLWLRRRWSGSRTTLSSSEIGSTSRAAHILRRRSKYGLRHQAQDRRIRDGTIHGYRSYFSSSAAEMDATAESWGNFTLTPCDAGNRMGMAHDASSAHFNGRCCCGFQFPSMRTRLRSVLCRFFFPCGGRIPGTTRVMEWKCSRRLRSDLGFVAQFVIAIFREFKRNLVPFAAAALYALVALNAWAVLRDHPFTYVESTKNHPVPPRLRVEIPPVLRSLLAMHPGGTVLMGTSVYPNWCRLRASRCGRPSTRVTRNISPRRLPLPPRTPQLCWPSMMTISIRPSRLIPRGSLGAAFHSSGTEPAARFTSPIPRLSTKLRCGDSIGQGQP